MYRYQCKHSWLVSTKVLIFQSIKYCITTCSISITPLTSMTRQSNQPASFVCLYPYKPLRWWKENWFGDMMANSALHIPRYFYLYCAQCFLITTNLSFHVYSVLSYRKAKSNSIIVCMCDNGDVDISAIYFDSCRAVMCAYTFMPVAFYIDCS